MQSVSCKIYPHSLFALGGGLGKPLHPTIANISVYRAPIDICLRLRIQTFCSRQNTFESGKASGLSSVAQELANKRPSSSKRKKKFKFRVGSNEASECAASGGEMTRDGHSALSRPDRETKRDKSTVCNSINGQTNAAVSNPSSSPKKGTGRNCMPPSTSKDEEREQKILEDTSGSKGPANNNDSIPDAKAPVSRNQKTRNKKHYEKKRAQNSSGNDVAKSKDKVHGTSTPVKVSHKLGNSRQGTDVSRNSSLSPEIASLQMISEESTQNADDESHLNKSNDPDSSTGVSKIQKQIRPLYPPSGKSIVVVESVTKARVIQNFLGDMYEVLPSHGHLRDLAGRSGSVRPDDDFSMVWEVPASAWTHLKSIKVALDG